MYFASSPLIGYIICKYILSFSRLHFHFIEVFLFLCFVIFFAMEKVFSVM